MPTLEFTAELAAYGPDSALGRPTLEESRAYCRRLARTHYENFAVASWLLPRRLRPHFYHIYAYCRWADDLADETGDKSTSRRLLDWWEVQLDNCYQGSATHPVFVALAETIAEFDIPSEPLRHLLVAFRQDQEVSRYETFEQLLDYCRYSANPVGRLVLYLARSHDEGRGRLADAICTGLQLANFWQDVARDWDRGRIYLPRRTCAQFGCGDEDFVARRASPAFRRALAFEVDRAECWLREGMPLVAMMPRRLRGDVWLFIHGGLKVLREIRRLDFNVWSARPVVSKSQQLLLLAGCVFRTWTPRAARGHS